MIDNTSFLEIHCQCLIVYHLIILLMNTFEELYHSFFRQYQSVKLIL